MPKLTHQNPISMTIPTNLQGFRLAKKVTQQKAADQMEFKYGTYVSLESGHLIPSRETLITLCAYYGCKPEDLYEPRTLVMVGIEPAELWLKPGAWWTE